MNLIHDRLCASAKWAEFVETSLFPRVLDDLDLGDHVLELGPGLGVTTRLLAGRIPKLTALEVEERYVTRLRDEGVGAEIVHGDATAMPFPGDSFTAVACFTMLHHVPGRELQDRLFAEACRVLRPGGIFVGSDGQPSFRFWLIHLFDTKVPVDPKTLPNRLTAAGFTDVRVGGTADRIHFTARKP